MIEGHDPASTQAAVESALGLAAAATAIDEGAGRPIDELLHLIQSVTAR
jgi:hypothetical protein